VVEKAGEEVGDDFFSELLSRSLIEQFNDLATIVAGLNLVAGSISKDVHHFSYNREESTHVTAVTSHCLLF